MNILRKCITPSIVLVVAVAILTLNISSLLQFGNGQGKGDLRGLIVQVQQLQHEAENTKSGNFKEVFHSVHNALLGAGEFYTFTIECDSNHGDPEQIVVVSKLYMIPGTYQNITVLDTHMSRQIIPYSFIDNSINDTPSLPPPIV